MFHILEKYNIIFYGKDLIVVAKKFDTKECVVTFTSRADENQLPQSPFGGNMLSSRRISHVCIISTSNHWWSTPEWLPCLDSVKNYISFNNMKKTVLYGGSMGGYGALSASTHLNPERIVTFGSQFSISPRVIPEDVRWADDWNRLFLEVEMKSPEIPCTAEVIYLYDPFTKDKLHVEKYNAHNKVYCIRLPFSGHELFNTLKELKLAGEIALYALSFDNSIDSIREKCCFSYRKHKRNSQLYWKNILNYKKKNRLKPAALRFLVNELDLNFVSKLALANELILTGADDIDEAKDIFFNAIQENPLHPAPWRGLWKVYASKEKYTLSLKSALIALANREDDQDLLRVVVLAANNYGDIKLTELVASILLEKDKNNVHTINVLNNVTFKQDEQVKITSEVRLRFHKYLLNLKNQLTSLEILKDPDLKQFSLPQL